MEEDGLSRFILDYIENRKRLRLEAAEKKFADDEPALAAERQEINDRYQSQAWLTDAASRAGQISLVTHALKFTHSDAKGSSVFSVQAQEESPEYLSTAALKQPAVDAVGNAAALDVAKLLQTEYQGDSLVAALQRGDDSALAALTDDPQQLAQWVTGFKQALTDKQLSSHKLAKQIYFPLSDTSADGQYHLISPLYSSSLAQALYQRITAARFSDEAKAVRLARKEKRWHDEIEVSFPNLAVQNMGGTKPQNISFLNSGRRGKSYLLPCAAPVWESMAKPPLQHKSIFRPRGEFEYLARSAVRQMRQFLLSVAPVGNTLEIRQQCWSYADSIIDSLFNYAAAIQNLEAGWSREETCRLKRSQQLWLDPYSALSDRDFKFEREGGDWKKEVAQDFGVWLNRQLEHEQLRFSEVERREWSTAALFKRRMRESESALTEEMR
ncbi:type I-F CRISPR-associated protein Csy1 [Brenneria tiliae]|uniref:type I-F CRISPR-associated protein Csy1 n=1 Tax=Brenneria tiliae TaxID=2914984 RepID=UPI002014D1E7|nr:type I-F CRISPR-associated protein Csy1 [Brenneria tiliae]MCL2898996.1 type I-F CRISPR-associated protein Csy1 [Brenneria tiliae]MCL2903067.1 type I-F CRISPR-associated protein Csy1 [Brenneria tiliae]